MEEGYIKLCRKLAAWEWYTDANTVRVFLHCLIMANWKDSRYRGHEVPRGSFVTGRKKLAQELKISEQSIRTALSHLISTNEITITKTPKFSIITVVKYAEYQTTNHQNNQQLTSNPPATNQQLTTIEERKNNKKSKNIYNAHARETSKGNNSEKLSNLEELYLDKVRKEARG